MFVMYLMYLDVFLFLKTMQFVLIYAIWPYEMKIFNEEYDKIELSFLMFLLNLRRIFRLISISVYGGYYVVICLVFSKATKCYLV